jgi:hypothetical protein
MMKTSDPRFELIRRCRDGEATAEELTELEAKLREDIGFRKAYVQYANIDVALNAVSKTMTFPVATKVNRLSRRSPWLSWSPLSAAAAGVMIGMFCTSLVYGFVAQRVNAVKKVAMEFFDPGFENAKQVLDDSMPRKSGQWGVDSAAVVTKENGVLPLEGKQMLRLDPIPREKEVKNHSSRVYQVLDLGSLPTDAISVDTEVKVTASFYSSRSDLSSRYLIRAVALTEPPEKATREFWSKTENDDVVSMSQRFDSVPGEASWQRFSLKMPLPRGSRTLVLILGAVPPEDESENAFVHYLDDVQVALITPQALQP